MEGEEAIVQALKKSADRFYAIPGYPVTGISEALASEPVINEKVALEYALGDSLAGRRAAVIMKNAGLNACADPLVQASTQGLCSGVVVVAGDDLVPAGSTSLQDSRYYGEVARVPVIEPGPSTCFAGVEEAFRASERFSRVAILRLTPLLLEYPIIRDRSERRDRPGVTADPALTMRGRVQREERLFNGLFSWSRENPLNSITGGVAGVGAAPGESSVVTAYPPPGGMRDIPAVCELGRSFVREHRCVEPGNCTRRSGDLLIPGISPHVLQGVPVFRTVHHDEGPGCEGGGGCGLFDPPRQSPLWGWGGQLRARLGDRRWGKEHGGCGDWRLCAPALRNPGPDRRVREENAPPVHRAAEPPPGDDRGSGRGVRPVGLPGFCKAPGCPGIGYRTIIEIM